MKKLLIILFMPLISMAQQQTLQDGTIVNLNNPQIGNPYNQDIFGTWSSWDGSTILYMNYGVDNTFQRTSKYDGKVEVATGTFEEQGKFLYVQKKDDEYLLMFYLKGNQLIVTKPKSTSEAGQVWLFTRVSYYGLNSSSD
jgi:hypothetical protein